MWLPESTLFLPSTQDRRATHQQTTLEYLRARKEHLPILLLDVFLAPALCCAVRKIDAHGTATTGLGSAHDIENLTGQAQGRGTGLHHSFNPHLSRDYGPHSSFSFTQGYGSLPQWQRQDYLTLLPRGYEKDGKCFKGKWGGPCEHRWLAPGY